MSKSKSASKGSKPAKSDVLTKVKDASVTKPAQAPKTKSKDVAKTVATKEDKKSKKSKKVKEPTPEPESDSDDSASSDSSEDEKKAAPVKANGAKKAVTASDDESDSSEDDAPAVSGVLGQAPAVTEADSDSDSDDESEAEAKPVKATKVAEAAKAEPSDEDSSDESGADAKAPAAQDNSSDDSEDSSDEEEAEAKPKSTKRKAEAEPEPAAKKTKTAAEGATPQSANLFVGNLSWNVDEAWLKEAFGEHGEIARVQLITDRATGRSKGFGYVEFVNAEDAAAAHAAKQGFELDSRALNVDFSNPRPPKPDQADRRKSYGDQVSEPSDTLFLGNLSFDVGQETVTEAFAPHGTIMGIRLPTDRETGEPKGFGYVTFASIDEAKAALDAMQGSYISSRPVRLDYSQPRPQNDSGGRGGGRGGGGFGGGRGRGGDRGGRGRGGFGGGRGRGGFDRGGRGGGRGGSTNRGGFGDFKGNKVSFD